jgi:predicted acyl esterase
MLQLESFYFKVNVPARMSDGTILYANICVPHKVGKYPAIFARLHFAAHYTKRGMNKLLLKF